MSIEDVYWFVFDSDGNIIGAPVGYPTVSSAAARAVEHMLDHPGVDPYVVVQHGPEDDGVCEQWQVRDELREGQGLIVWRVRKGR